MLSPHSWTVLLREKGVKINGITKPGMSLLAGWLDEGIEVALDRAVLCYNAGKATNKFGHSSHIQAAAGNPQWNRSQGLNMPNDVRQLIQQRGQRTRELQARLGHEWKMPREAYSLSHPAFKRVWKEVKKLCKIHGLKVNIKTAFGTIFVERWVRAGVQAAFNMADTIYDAYLLNTQPMDGLISQENAIRVPAPLFLISQSQHMGHCDVATLASWAYRSGNKNARAGADILVTAINYAPITTRNGVFRSFKKFATQYKKCVLGEGEPCSAATAQSFAKAVYRGLYWGSYVNQGYQQNGGTPIAGGDLELSYATAVKDKEKRLDAYHTVNGLRENFADEWTVIKAVIGAAGG